MLPEGMYFLCNWKDRCNKSYQKEQMEVLELKNSLERLNRVEKNSTLWHRRSLTQNGSQNWGFLGFFVEGSPFSFFYILTQIWKQPKAWNCQWMQTKKPQGKPERMKKEDLMEPNLFDLASPSPGKHQQILVTLSHTFPLVAKMVTKGQSPVDPTHPTPAKS